MFPQSDPATKGVIKKKKNLSRTMSKIVVDRSSVAFVGALALAFGLVICENIQPSPPVWRCPASAVNSGVKPGLSEAILGLASDLAAPQQGTSTPRLRVQIGSTHKELR